MPPAVSRYSPITPLLALFVAAPAVALVPATALAADWSKAQRFAVALVDDAFKPADLSFHVGTAYRVHLENKGKETHEFTAPDFFKTIDARDPDMTGADHTEIVIQPGQKKDFYFVAKQAGSYDLRCSDHDWAGMVGHITVTP
jgi:uncharacterized cupredoxin-like copper-binding protein